MLLWNTEIIIFFLQAGAVIVILCLIVYSYSKKGGKQEDSEKYLSDAIDSILEQDFEEFELILVDDGSEDGSGEICDRYANKNEKVIVIHKKNEGSSSARNVALDIAKGEYNRRVSFLREAV